MDYQTINQSKYKYVQMLIDTSKMLERSYRDKHGWDGQRRDFVNLSKKLFDFLWCEQIAVVDSQCVYGWRLDRRIELQLSFTMIEALYRLIDYWHIVCKCIPLMPID